MEIQTDDMAPKQIPLLQCKKCWTSFPETHMHKFVHYDEDGFVDAEADACPHCLRPFDYGEKH